MNSARGVNSISADNGASYQHQSSRAVMSRRFPGVAMTASCWQQGASTRSWPGKGAARRVAVTSSGDHLNNASFLPDGYWRNRREVPVARGLRWRIHGSGTRFSRTPGAIRRSSRSLWWAFPAGFPRRTPSSVSGASSRDGVDAVTEVPAGRWTDAGAPGPAAGSSRTWTVSTPPSSGSPRTRPPRMDPAAAAGPGTRLGGAGERRGRPPPPCGTRRPGCSSARSPTTTPPCSANPGGTPTSAPTAP